jgi:hypothetical protein
MLPNFPYFLDIKVTHIITLLLPHPLPVIIQQLSYQSTLYIILTVEIIAKFFQDNQTRKLQHTLLITDRTSVSTLHRAVATVHDPTVHPSTHPTPPPRKVRHPQTIYIFPANRRSPFQMGGASIASHWSDISTTGVHWVVVTMAT